MPKPYSNDLRERVVDAVEREGLSRNQAAARFGVAVSTAITWVARYRATGSFAPEGGLELTKMECAPALPTNRNATIAASRLAIRIVRMRI